MGNKYSKFFIVEERTTNAEVKMLQHYLIVSHYLSELYTIFKFNYQKCLVEQL